MESKVCVVPVVTTLRVPISLLPRTDSGFLYWGVVSSWRGRGVTPESGTRLQEKVTSRLLVPSLRHDLSLGL